MITGKLINPRIIYDREGNKLSFDNTLIFEKDGIEIERQDINLPYSMPDAEIETLVKQMLVDKAASLEITQEQQATLQWDWPQWDMEVDNGNA